MSRKTIYCNIPNCKDIAQYGMNDDKNKPYWCETHMNELKDMDKKNIFLFIKPNKIYCRDKECYKTCFYNFKENTLPIFCSSHKMDNMISFIKKKLCITESCDGTATYGKRDDTKEVFYCIDCFNKMNDKDLYINKTVKRCLGNDKEKCELTPKYNYPDQKTGKYCKNHALSGMIDIAHPKCIYIEKTDEGEIKCLINASFSLPDSKKLEYCKKHSLLFEGSFNSTPRKKCEFFNKLTEKNCAKLALFGFIEDNKKIYCGDHQIDRMINLTVNFCQYKEDDNNCKKTAIFGYEKDKKKIMCKDHKLTDMINLDSNLCIYINSDGIKCEVNASFGKKGCNKKEYCLTHAKELKVEYEDIQHKKCTYTNKDFICDDRARYGFYSDKIKMYCYKHSQENMIDLDSKKCEYENKDFICLKRARFGFLTDKKYKFCYIHRLEEMINLDDSRCIEEECLNIAYYNYIGLKKKYIVEFIKKMI